MNVYVETSVQNLHAICAGQMSFRDHLNHVTQSVRERIKGAEEIVVCGLSPIGRNCLAHIDKYSDCAVRVFDIRNSDAADKEKAIDCLNTGGGYSAYIICSREDAKVYLDSVPMNGSKIVSYNELLLLDERFSVKNSLLHNQSYVRGMMKSVFEHADAYLQLLDALEDAASQETLACWILYRLYQDINLLRGLRQSARPYFSTNLLALTEETVFVDAGGYDGDTLSDFLAVTNGAFHQYHFFEPEPAVFAKARQVCENDERITFYQKGLSNKTSLERFDDQCADMPEMMKSDTGNVMVEVCALDDFDLAPTIIKMDIEGAECDALDGAARTIRACRPELAICVYHRPDDLLDIYRKIKDFGYCRFYLRTEKGTLDFDVVLYAV